MTLVYRHRRDDTGEVFYIGIGGKKRPGKKVGRNPFWKNITNKTPYTVEILCACKTKEEACELEMFLISEYGRRDLNEGPLVNLTDGGEGTKSCPCPEFTKQAVSRANKGNTYSAGRKHTKEAKKRISQANKGRKNRARKVVNTDTGLIYESVREAADKLDLNRNTLTQRLNGNLKNKTKLKYYE